MELSSLQRKIVELREHNILVSAAAGSGKTRVLVERIMSRLTDIDDPIDIDQILVLTFTKAAAGEMRDRIAKAISKRIEQGDRSEHMLKQAALVFNAQISTIDSFCLDILRNNFAQIGLEPGFRTAKKEEISTLSEEALDETLEEVLALEDIEYLDDFLDRFECKDNLRKIKAAVLDTYENACNAPFIEDYIEQRRLDYKAGSKEDLMSSVWYTDLWKDISDTLTKLVNAVQRLRSYCEENGLNEYEGICDSDEETIRRLADTKDPEKLANLLNMGVSFDTLPRKTACDESIKKEAQRQRKSYKDIINDIATRYAFSDINVQIERMEHTRRAVSALLDIVLRYHVRLDEKKREKGLVTFSDMEHMALKILLKKENGQYVPTQVAKDYRGTYRELMIDEYQDSNYTQEWLIHSISGEDDGIYDRFMVGDIKQSIYRFRNADPDLFAGKYDEYSSDEKDPKVKIDLSVNYRSRKEVLNTVNTVFERTFDRYMGGMDYDDRQRLNYGELYDAHDPEDGSYKSELLIFETGNDTRESRERLEGRMLAVRIKRLLSELKVYDDSLEDMRNCRYSDIVILLRSMTYDADELRRTLEEEGIPVHVASRGGFFDTNEITAVINFLRVIDNPGNNIPMYGTLISVFGGFDENDAACLKLFDKENMYMALKEAIDLDEEETGKAYPDAFKAAACVRGGYAGLRNRCVTFMEKLGMYRDMVPYTPVYKLLRRIYSDHDYVDHLASLPAGEQKKANALALLSKAEIFEQDGFRGIFDFNRYVERMHKYESDEGEVMSLDENADVIRIMTMHKSKGLEYPVCILAGLNRKFNLRDSSEEIIFHNRYGMGLDYTDSAKRVKYRDIRKAYIAGQLSREARSEEMRVLYVAMTRAKEKLIMSATVKSLDDEFGVFEGDPHSITERKKIGSFLDILRLSRENDDWNGQCDLIAVKPENITISQISEAVNTASDRDTLIYNMTHMSCLTKEDERVMEGINARIGYVYPHSELCKLYTKTSVSELKIAAIENMMQNGESKFDAPAHLFKNDDADEYIPGFVRNDKDAVTGAAIGSAYHRVMELIDYTKIEGFGPDTLDEQMKHHIASQALSDEDYSLINKQKVVRFMKSELAARMGVAARKGELYKERPFVLGLAANRLNPDFPEEEMVLVQGIIDAYFVEDGHIVLLDYKTDAVKTDKELVTRYRTQLDYYEEALARLTGKPVSERLLYSFALEKVISC